MDEKLPPSELLSLEANGRRVAALADRSIVLVGLMGAGKSSVGKRLAHVLNWPFIDADDAIEEAANMSISDIFAKFGESSFRDGERRVIARLLGNANDDDASPGFKVIATGGGAFMNGQTRALIKASGCSIWLDADIATLVERVGRRSNRPLLKDKDPAVVLSELAAVRNPVYAEADLRVTSAAGPHSDTTRKVLSALERHFAQAQPASPSESSSQ